MAMSAAQQGVTAPTAKPLRDFHGDESTTLALARAYDSLGINRDSVKEMPFESLVTSMQSPALLQVAKALLDRLETRLVTSASSSVDDIDHLLKHLVTSPPRRKAPPRRSSQGTTKRSLSATSPGTATARYSPRVVLSAYMIVAHPGAVLSGQGEEEKELKESAAIFVRELEHLINPRGTSTSRRWSDGVEVQDSAGVFRQGVEV